MLVTKRGIRAVEENPNPLHCVALFSPQAITEEMLFSTILVLTREVENVSRSQRFNLVCKRLDF